MSEALGTPIDVACVEDEDFDCIARYIRADELVLVPIQIKELAPADLNPKATLSEELSKLTKYATSRDLVVAIYLNRNERVVFSEIVIPELETAELWFLGALSPRKDEWLLYGNALRNPSVWTFRYPT
jgi:hypothetical protein